MTQVEVRGAARDYGAVYTADASRGDRIGRVSSAWISRPADERYLSPSDLFAVVYGRAERSRTRTVESAAIRAETTRENAWRWLAIRPDLAPSRAGAANADGQLHRAVQPVGRFDGARAEGLG
jgi:hypothetical protein